MDLIREYEFDALPYIDKDYDDPVIREAVQALVTAEMRSFAPRAVPEYLAALAGLRVLPEVAPLLRGASRSAAMEGELRRISSRGAPAPRVDISRYDPASVLPTGSLEKDPQAWRRSLVSSQVQLELEASRLLGLEVAEVRGGPVWLHHNNHIDAAIKYYERQTESLRSKIEATNMRRKAAQESVLPALARQASLQLQAVAKCQQIQMHCRLLEQELGPEALAEVERETRGGSRERAEGEGDRGAAVLSGTRRPRLEDAAAADHSGDADSGGIDKKARVA